MSVRGIPVKRCLAVLFAALYAANAPVLRAQTGNTAATETAAASASLATQTAATTTAQELQGRSFLPNPQLALATPDYQVTAGDVYTLAYLALGQGVEYLIPVDSSYRLRIANMGVIDGSGKTFAQLKAQVEAIVTNNYPMSGVQFILTRPAVFKVYVRGEVSRSAEITAWALSRLSSVASANLTSLSSLRDVTIRSAGGQTRVYDLFKALRLGDLTQDPYLRPDDVITFNQVDRTVTLEGAVHRPGSYQLMSGENLKDLIEFYGLGFTPVADTTRLALLRRVHSVSVSGDKVFLQEEDVTANYALENYDRISVPEIIALEPVIFVEGAVYSGTIDSTDGSNSSILSGATLTSSTRLVIPFNKGENYAALVRRNKSWFVAVSDTQNAYIIRELERIPLNLNPMLYDVDYRSEVLIQENDTLIIPFRQYFVTVSGAVIVPGRYPYIPDREWDYYIALAGGFVPGRNARQSITITDIQGHKLKKQNIITPETVITAKTNDPLYYFNQYAPVITTTLSIITTFLSLQVYLSTR